MDFAGGLRGLRALLDGPGAGLVLTGCQEADQAEELVARGNQLVEAGDRDAERLEIVCLFALVERGDFLFNLCGDAEDFALMCGRVGTDSGDMRIGSAVVREIVFFYVGRVDDGFCGQKAERSDKGRDIGIIRLKGGGRLAVLEQNFQVFSSFRISSSFFKLLSLFADFCVFAMRRSRTSRSAKMSSRLMVSMSRTGSTEPST